MASQQGATECSLGCRMLGGLLIKFVCQRQSLLGARQAKQRHDLQLLDEHISGMLDQRRLALGQQGCPVSSRSQGRQGIMGNFQFGLCNKCPRLRFHARGRIQLRDIFLALLLGKD